MPIATPIATALAEAPLVTIVAALAEIAGTLARLAERSVGHRDIKPGNLYEFNGHSSATSAWSPHPTSPS